MSVIRLVSLSQGIHNRELGSIELNTHGRYVSDPVQPEPNQNFLSRFEEARTGS